MLNIYWQLSVNWTNTVTGYATVNCLRLYSSLGDQFRSDFFQNSLRFAVGQVFGLEICRRDFDDPVDLKLGNYKIELSEPSGKYLIYLDICERSDVVL